VLQLVLFCAGGVVAMAVEGPLIAVAQAGKQAVVLLQCTLDGETAQLTRKADIVIDTVALPSRLCFTAPNSLWAIGTSGGKGLCSVGRVHQGAGRSGLPLVLPLYLVFVLLHVEICC
jgi:hypothetical protein